MARLPKGATPIPHQTRLKKYREELARSGGRRVIVDIEAEPARALESVMERSGGTIKQVVSEALVAFSGGKLPRKRATAKKKAPATP